MAGAPIGNTNPGDGKMWRAAIRRALEKRANSSRKEAHEALTDLAEKFLEACEEKQGWALKELGDRIDGKVVQEIAGSITVTHEQALAALFNQPVDSDSETINTTH